MQVTFMLGNGFDKSIGLETGYPEFYEWYYTQVSDSDEVDLLKDRIKSSIEKGNDNWADFEIALGLISGEISNRDKFIKCFQSAKASLMQYLTEEYTRKTSQDKDFIKSAAYGLVELSQNLDEDISDNDKAIITLDRSDYIFNCISFNYTPLFIEGQEILCETAHGISCRDQKYEQYTIGEVINVHGVIDNDPILGVNDTSQIANESFRNDEEIVQLMVKGEADKHTGHGWRKKAIDIIQKSDIVYIFGMSLGDTDLFWWKQLANWLEKDSKHSLIINCYPEGDVDQKKTLLYEKIAKHYTNRDGKFNIVVDTAKKSMTVQFVRASVNAVASFSAYAEASVISVAELHDREKRTED